LGWWGCGVDARPVVFVKSIIADYAACSYGKQHEQLYDTTKPLAHRWYAMVKFCEIHFASSQHKVYVKFEKNYTTYRRRWGSDNA
jgi:hypothetical protein